MQANDVFYQSVGQSKHTVVLLHSGGMAGEEWQPQIQPLSKRYKVIVPDLPGHGKTPLSDDTLTIEKMANAVLEVMDAEEIESAHFCGSSMGGAVALWLTVNHPDRVKKAVFYRISYRKNTATHEQTLSMSDPDYWAQYGLAKWLSRLHEPQGGKDAWKRVIARVSESLDPNTTQHDHSIETLKAISQPVLIVAGDRDPVAPLEDALTMYQHIPNAGLWVLPYATHITATNTWRSDAFAEELRRFFGQS